MSSWRVTTSKRLLKALYSSFLELNLRENGNYASKACLSNGKTSTECKMGLVTLHYTTSTVCDICTIAVLCSVTRPFLLSLHLGRALHVVYICNKEEF